MVGHCLGEVVELEVGLRLVGAGGYVLVRVGIAKFVVVVVVVVVGVERGPLVGVAVVAILLGDIMRD